eukprot:959418-Rhodomonas_salina.2
MRNAVSWCIATPILRMLAKIGDEGGVVPRCAHVLPSLLLHPSASPPQHQHDTTVGANHSRRVLPLANVVALC